ncbi:uncharacterized protein LOC131997266 [Stomoxys calcitrans]|uniref:uncharacterized protein LOC131997266 n=1 Tax=Stomoxys calcitrans TaxID=35570 RepID=UPI0027E3931A|nr:uncharacterized protein LOC131997266 [Stomoxys calcitrans]
MDHRRLLFLMLLYYFYQGTKAGLRLKFTKIFCHAVDPTYPRVDWCILKAVSRNLQYYKCRFTPLHLPLTEYRLRVQVFKRLTGWKPFLYDITVGCNFTRHLNVITRLAWNIVSNVSNINMVVPIISSVWNFISSSSRLLFGVLNYVANIIFRGPTSRAYRQQL